MSVVIEKKDYFYQLIPVYIELTEADREDILEQFPVPEIPEGNQTFHLDEQAHGSYAQDIMLLLSSHSVEYASNGNPYLKMTFTNSAGSFSAKMWDNNGALERVLPLLEQYSLFNVDAKIEEFPRQSGKKSLVISRLDPIDIAEVEPLTLLPYTKESLVDLTLELYTYLDALPEPHRSIGIKGMKRFWKEFALRPAAKGYHHNYLGGLLKHTVGLMRIARFILDGQEPWQKRMMRLIHVVEQEHKKEVWANFQAQVPVDARKLVWTGTIDHLYSIFNNIVSLKGNEPNAGVLLASIFYHDLGKIMEYTHAGKEFAEFQFLYPTADISSLNDRKPTGITMDPLGALVGHMPYGILMLAKVLETENIQVSIEDIHLYNHCILAHHGKHEWQSSVLPATVEANLLHFVDFLDSRYETSELMK